MKNFLFLCLLISGMAYSQQNEPSGTNQHSNRLPVLLNGKWGYIDTTGRIIIEPRFESADFFVEGYAAVSIGGKWGYINTKGEQVIPPQFDDAYEFEDGIATVKKDSAYCFIRKDGSILHCQPRYSNPGEGLLPFQEGTKWGYMDYTGKRIVPPVYDLTMQFSEGLGSVGFDTPEGWKFGFVNREGKVVIEPQFKNYSFFVEGLAPVQLKDWKYGFINKQEEFVIPEQFDYAYAFREGVAMVGEYNQDHRGDMISWGDTTAGAKLKWWFINRTGKPVFDREFDQVGSFRQGYLSFREGGKWGYIDRTGKVVIEPKFDSVDEFRDGMAYVTIGDKAMFIDIHGHVKKFPQFDAIGWFINGFATVLEGGTFKQWWDGDPSNDAPIKLGYINREGKVIWKPSR